jgi:hypothetical protein
MEKVPARCKLESRCVVAADVSPLQSYANFWKSEPAHASCYDEEMYRDGLGRPRKLSWQTAANPEKPKNAALMQICIFSTSLRLCISANDQPDSKIAQRFSAGFVMPKSK